MQLKLGREPHRLDATHPLIIEEMLALAAAGKAVAISTMIEMLADVVKHGRESRFMSSWGGHRCGSSSPRVAAASRAGRGCTCSSCRPERRAS